MEEQQATKVGFFFLIFLKCLAHFPFASSFCEFCYSVDAVFMKIPNVP
jgi:hypothetical protein